jgi:hypothetical protein
MGSESTDPFFLTAALDGGERSASRPCRSNPGERASGTHWIGGWSDPRARLDNTKKGTFLSYRSLNSDPSVVQPIAGRYTDRATAAIWYRIRKCVVVFPVDNFEMSVLCKTPKAPCLFSSLLSKHTTFFNQQTL